MHHIIRRPSAKDYKLYVVNNNMVDYHIVLSGVNTAEDIFGKDEGSLQGKTAQYKYIKVQSTYINKPKNLRDRYHSFTLSADFMFVNGIPFFIKISHYIKFIT